MPQHSHTGSVGSNNDTLGQSLIPQCDSGLQTEITGKNFL